jgi:hypothetical protein
MNKSLGGCLGAGGVCVNIILKKIEYSKNNMKIVKNNNKTSKNCLDNDAYSNATCRKTRRSVFQNAKKDHMVFTEWLKKITIISAINLLIGTLNTTSFGAVRKKINIHINKK